MIGADGGTLCLSQTRIDGRELLAQLCDLRGKGDALGIRRIRLAQRGESVDRRGELLLGLLQLLHLVIGCRLALLQRRDLLVVGVGGGLLAFVRQRLGLLAHLLGGRRLGVSVHHLSGGQFDRLQLRHRLHRIVDAQIDLQAGVTFGDGSNLLAAHCPRHGLADGGLVHAEFGRLLVLHRHRELIARLGQVGGDVDQVGDGLHHRHDLIVGLGELGLVRTLHVDHDLGGGIADADLDATHRRAQIGDAGPDAADDVLR